MNSRWLLVCVAVLVSRTAAAQINTVASDLSVEPPTLVSLGFDWKISGDDNRNAKVDVAFRKRGAQQWRTGLPLRPVALQAHLVAREPQ